MKKDTKIYLILTVIIVIIITSIYILKNPNGETIEEKTVKCIAEKSVIYSSLNCGACKTQKQIFGAHYNLINEIDCFYESQKCKDAGISGTPTWIINNKQYQGVQSIQRLKELTGC